MRRDIEREREKEIERATLISVRNNTNVHTKKITRERNGLKKQENPERMRNGVRVFSGEAVAYRKMLSVREAVTWRRVASQ
jgi:hypothetical protein